jgi:hypothetical protein
MSGEEPNIAEKGVEPQQDFVAAHARQWLDTWFGFGALRAALGPTFPEPEVMTATEPLCQNANEGRDKHDR